MLMSPKVATLMLSVLPLHLPEPNGDTLGEVIVQVYTAQTPTEAVEMSRLGVDHVGVTISRRGLPGEVGLEEGKEIIAAVEDSPAKSVALTVETDPSKICEFVVEVRPDVLHLCGDTDVVGPGHVAGLREWVSSAGLDTELMQAIAVTGPESVLLAREFQPHVDWIILDSVTEAVEGIGAAGVTHDWELSREIVNAVAVPVILAGGLGPNNVGQAIAAVQPAGVDSLTLTNRYEADGSFSKDLAGVHHFVEAAHS